MGYDMYVCDREGNTVDEARLPEYDPTDSASMEAAWSAQDQSHCYLRRNIWGMGTLRQALVDAGMAYEAANPTRWDDFPASLGDEHYDENWNPVTEEAKLRQKQTMEVLRRTGDEQPGIPLHKLGDNSGWWVTEHECRSALHLWQEAGAPTPECFYDDLIPFLRQAAAHGGFRVY